MAAIARTHWATRPACSAPGAGDFNLDIRPVAGALAAFSPNVEVGARIDLEDGRWIRPYGTLGVTIPSDDHFTGRARFQGTGTLGLFATQSSIPDRLGEAGLGLQLSLGNGVEVTGEYRSQTGAHVPAQSGTARPQLRF